MANASNKHKAQGKKPVVVKESWWTPQRIKIAIAAVAVLVLIFIGVKVVGYFNGLQDSVVGQWSYTYESPDTAEPMEVVFTFNEDMTCNFVRTRAGAEEATMNGYYDIDDNYDVISMMMGSDGSTILQYYYDCDDDALKLVDFTTSATTEYVKVK